MILIGYSGHALVAAGIVKLMGKEVTGYCDTSQKGHNPLQIAYLGSENNTEVADQIESSDFFISIGENMLRRNVAERFENLGKFPMTIIHPSAVIDKSAEISSNGVMISAGVIINPFSDIRKGVILNTGSIIEHECVINNFAHIGPGAVLCGNVIVGENSFVGAGSVVRQGINIGNNVIIGAGSVVVKNISDNECVVGNPAKHLKKSN